MNSTLALILSVVAGLLAGIQTPVNAALGKTIGFLESSLVSFAVGAGAMAVVVSFIGRGNLNAITRVPLYLLAGGLLGATLFTIVIMAAPVIGTATTLAAVVVGQMTAALIFDHFGLLGVARVPIDVSRLGGLVLLFLGLRLMTR